MDNFDMSGVDPLRLIEVRRRVLIIERFLTIAKPTQMQRDAHAERVGLSTKSFMRLVSIWKRRRKPADLDGAGAPERQPRRNRMPEETRSAIVDASRELGPDATLAAITERAAIKAVERGTQVVGRSAVWNVLMEERRDSGTHASEPAVLIAQVFVKIPVEVDGQIVLPCLELAVLVPEAAIIAHRVAAGEPPSRDLSWLRKAVHDATTAGSPPRKILTTSFAADSRKHNHSDNQRLLTVTLGRGIGALDVAYRVTDRTLPSVMPKSRIGRPPNLSDAVDIICTAINDHNSRRCPVGIPAFDLTLGEDAGTLDNDVQSASA